MAQRFFDLYRAVAGSAGRAAFQRAAPLYFAILVAATIIFGGQGMRAADVTGLSQRSPIFRLVLWGLWLLATTPAARAVLCEPTLLFLRSLPVPRRDLYLAQGILLFAVEGPWIALFTRGAGVAAGVTVFVMAMAAHTLIVGRPQRALEWLSSGLLLLTLALGWPWPGCLAVAILGLPIGFRSAWLRAADRSADPGRPLLRGPAICALGLAYFLTLWRGHGALIWRAILLALLGAAIATLAVRNNHILNPETRSTLSLGILSAPLLLGAGGFAGPILRSERQADWLLCANGVGGAARVLSTSLPVAVCAMIIGGLHGLLIGLLIHATSLELLRLGLGAAMAGAALGFIASACVRWAQRGDKKDGDRVLLGLIILLVFAALATWLLHELSIGLYWALALVLIDRAVTAMSPRGRWLRLRREHQQGEPS